MNDAPRNADYTFNFSCGRCASVLEGRAAQGGQPGRCPTCGFVLEIPAIDDRTGLPHARSQGGGTAPAAPVHAYAAAGRHAPRIHQVARGTWVIICPRCAGHSQIAADRCGACGVPFTLEGTTPELPGAVAGSAALALLCGLLSVPVSICAARIGLVVAIGGITLSWTILQRYESMFPRASRALPWTSLGLSVIGLAIAGIRILKWV